MPWLFPHTDQDVPYSGQNFLNHMANDLRTFLGLTSERISLFLSCKRALSPAILQALDDEAEGDPYQVDLLIMPYVFRADHQQKYAHLTLSTRP
jgi:hypothetical protein